MRILLHPSSNASSILDTDRVALALLTLLLALVLEPIVFRGHVTVPLDNRSYLYLQPVETDYPQLPRLSDVNRTFIPTLHLHVRENFTGWIATWNPYVQLGQPLSHLGGLSKAYPITYVLSWLTQDPYRLHAWISAITVALLTFFPYLLLRALDLRPAAALIGAVGIGLNTRTAYWFGFTEVLAWGAWSLGIMWLSVLLIRRPRLLTWLGIVFCCFCLIIGGRQQATIRTAYLVVPFVLTILFVETRIGGWHRRLRLLGALSSAVLASLILSFPVVYDLLINASASTRANTDMTEFILASWRPFFNDRSALLWNGFVFGNPSRPDYLPSTLALNVTPFFFALFIIAITTGVLRRAWLFVAVFLFFLAMSVFRIFYLFAIEHLGFGFARANPIGGLYLPLFILCAFAADSLLRDPTRRKISVARGLVTVLIATTLGVAAVFVFHEWDNIHRVSFIVGLISAALAAAFVRWRSPLPLYSAALLLVVAFVAPALVHRPLREVARSSPLVELLREHTDGHRFAKLGAAGTFLPSSQETLVGLASIHSYDSLAPAAYVDLIETLSERGMDASGRHFDALDRVDRLLDDELSYAGVRAVLSDRALPFADWEVLDAPRDLLLHVDPEPAPLVAQVLDFHRVDDEARLDVELQSRPRIDGVRIVEKLDDLWMIETAALGRASLLFVSMQFHRAWVARAGGTELPTIQVDGFYQGVLLPPGVARVELRFEPLARWAWVPHVFFILAFPLALARHVRRSSRS